MAADDDDVDILGVRGLEHGDARFTFPDQVLSRDALLPRGGDQLGECRLAPDPDLVDASVKQAARQPET